MPSSYLLHVLSVPFGVDDSTWAKWYTTEHLPDLVYCNVSDAGHVYSKIDNPLKMEAPDDKRYLAMYHSDTPRQLDCKEYINDVRHDSGLWGYGKTAKSVGKFDIRNYKFIRQFNPKDVADGAAKYAIHFEIDCENEDEMNEWYDQIIHPGLAQLPGYSRSLHYQAGIMEDGSPGDKVAKFISVHQFDTLSGLSKEVLGEDTDLGKKVIVNSRIFCTRAFSLIGADPEQFRPVGFVNPAYNPIPKGHDNPAPKMEVLTRRSK